MSRRREVEAKLQGLAEIGEILGSMKTLALLETRKLARFLESQQRVVAGIEAAAADFAHFHPLAPHVAPREAIPPTFVLIGSERGFCGDFNERLVARFEALAGREAVGTPTRLVAVGRKLCVRLAGDARLVASLDGPNIAEEVDEIISALGEALSGPRAGGALSVLHHSDVGDEPRVRHVFPPFRDGLPMLQPWTHPPLLNLPPATFLAELLDHYLFALLHEMLYDSLMAENRERMAHLEGAVQRLEERTRALRLERNRTRQEEITEEIEVILLSAQSLLEPAAREADEVYNGFIYEGQR